MRRLSVALSLSLLLPSIAFAAFETPSALFSAIYDPAIGKTFSMSAHGASQEKVYASMWMNGSAQGIDLATMKVTTKATVDVVHGDFKVRVKADLLVTDGMLYAKLTSVDSDYQSALASFSGMLKQQQWIKIPMDEAMFEDVTMGTPLSLSPDDLSDLDNMFHMQATPGKNGGTVYAVTLNPDYAADLAMLIRDMLGDDTPVSNDFFPWRELAEGLRFEMTVFTNNQDKFVSSTFSLSQETASSSFSISGSEKALGGPLNVQAPANALTIDEVLSSFGSLTGMDDAMMDLPEMEEPEMMEEDVNFETIDAEESVTTGADCDDPYLDPIKLVAMQRTGECPVEKASTRYGGW